MSWSNWIYLGVGVGLGLGSSWLLGRSKKSAVSLPAPLSSSEANQEVPALGEQLKQTQIAYQLAHEMSQFKAGFLARTSHELRSPLNSLIGLHQLILSDLCDSPDEEREFIAQANQSALKLMNLIDQILEVSRIEHGTSQLEIQPLHLASVLQSAYNLTHLLAANRNIRLQLSPPEPEIYVLADPRWLRQVLVNLIDTCIAQMEEGGIFVSAQSTPVNESVQIWLDVQLPPSNWSEPLNLIQSESLPRSASPSPGMALLLNQKLLEQMQAYLEIVSVPKEADNSAFSRIQLTIPLVIPEIESLEQEGN
jgi:signal transduction histidine kinase